jgi:serine/threonine protein kinase
LDDHFAHLFIDSLNDPDLSPQLNSSIQQLKATKPIGPRLRVQEICDKLGCKGYSNVVIRVESNDNLTVVKTMSIPNPIERIKKEVIFYKTMNHPLIVRYFPTPLNSNPAITTEFMKNGSLENHLSNAKNPDLSLLKHPTKIAKIIAGIVLAMRYVHSKDIIHGDLTPENILLDWDWKVRIANFGRSTFTNTVIDPNTTPRGDAHYLAPECYENIIVPENDIFSFGLILYELMVGEPVFPKSMIHQDVMGKLVLGNWEPNIPSSVHPRTRDLIRDCWAVNFLERLSFNEILDRLKEMRFKLSPKVNSSKVTAFVKEIQEWEAKNCPQ